MHDSGNAVDEGGKVDEDSGEEVASNSHFPSHFGIRGRKRSPTWRQGSEWMCIGYKGGDVAYISSLPPRHLGKIRALLILIYSQSSNVLDGPTLPDIHEAERAHLSGHCTDTARFVAAFTALFYT